MEDENRRFDKMNIYDPLNLLFAGQVQPDHKELYFKGQFLTEERIIQPFTASHSGTQYPIRPWKFLDILTTGGINPRNNDIDIAFGYPRLELIFDDGEHHQIRGEVYNLPLVGKQHFQLFNEVSPYAGGNRTLESGFNEMIFVLKNYPWVRQVEKNHPTWCSSFQMTDQDVVRFWFGDWLMTVNGVIPTLAIPWLPKIYPTVRVCLSYKFAEATPITAEWYEYCCYGEQDECNSRTVSLIEGCNSVSLCSPRHALVITHGGGEAVDVCVQVTFLPCCGDSLCTVPA